MLPLYNLPQQQRQHCPPQPTYWGCSATKSRTELEDKLRALELRSKGQKSAAEDTPQLVDQALEGS